eukprot:3633016-Rhodomonas_salina.5
MTNPNDQFLAPPLYPLLPPHLLRAKPMRFLSKREQFKTQRVRTGAAQAVVAARRRQGIRAEVAERRGGVVAPPTHERRAGARLAQECMARSIGCICEADRGEKSSLARPSGKTIDRGGERERKRRTASEGNLDT